MSSPRLQPWLMPETIRSAVKPSTSPSDAKRTQSTGVPSGAKPTVPSPKSISSTHSGRRVVIERAVAERLPSGAMTASSTSPTSSSARRSACRPSASIPSSLVSSTRSTAPRIDLAAGAVRAPLLHGAGVVAPDRRDEEARAVEVHDREAHEDRAQQPEHADRHHQVVGARIRADEVGHDPRADEDQPGDAQHRHRAGAAAPQRKAERPPRRRLVEVELAL